MWATRRTSVREHRFAAVKAALRKQSLTHEPYSNQVATKLWQILQHRKAEHGNTRVFRKELQHELTEALAPERHSNIMSKNKINKIFQVLIRSCFTLLSRETCEASGFHIEDEDEELLHATSPKPARPAAAVMAPAVMREPPPLSADEISYFTRTGLMTPAHTYQQAQQLLQQQEEHDAEKENDEDDYYCHSDDADQQHQQSHSCGAVCELLDTVHSAREMIQQHNALIVRVAAEAGVSMTGQEWNEFFSAPPLLAPAPDTGSYQQHSSQGLFGAAPAAATGISASSTSEKAARAAALAAARAADPLGTLSEDELCAFKTQPCLLGDPHPADKCNNSHSSELGAAAWLRRDPRELRYQPRRCADSVAHGPRGCRLGAACSLSHSEEEVRFHPLVYKTRLCPQGLACELRRYCPYLHTRQQQQQQAAAPVRPTRAAVALCAGEAGGSSGTAVSYSTSPPAAAKPVAAAAVNWDAVSTLGGCKPAAAAFSSGSSFAGDAVGGYGGNSSMSGTGSRLWVDRRRIVGVPALLAALRKRSADLLQPPVRHKAMMQEVYVALRRHEPMGIEEKDLLASVHRSLQLPSVPLRYDAGGTGESAYSKTKVRGLVTLLKFAGTIRVANTGSCLPQRGYQAPHLAAGHTLHVARNLRSFSQFLDAHNRHLAAVAKELGLVMTVHDWQQVMAIPGDSTSSRSSGSSSTATSEAAAAAAAARARVQQSVAYSTVAARHTEGGEGAQAVPAAAAAAATATATAVASPPPAPAVSPVQVPYNEPALAPIAAAAAVNTASSGGATAASAGERSQFHPTPMQWSNGMLVGRSGNEENGSNGVTSSVNTAASTTTAAIAPPLQQQQRTPLQQLSSGRSNAVQQEQFLQQQQQQMAAQQRCAMQQERDSLLEQQARQRQQQAQARLAVSLGSRSLFSTPLQSERPPQQYYPSPTTPPPPQPARIAVSQRSSSTGDMHNSYFSNSSSFMTGGENVPSYPQQYGSYYQQQQPRQQQQQQQHQTPFQPQQQLAPQMFQQSSLQLPSVAQQSVMQQQQQQQRLAFSQLPILSTPSLNAQQCTVQQQQQQMQYWQTPGVAVAAKSNSSGVDCGGTGGSASSGLTAFMTPSPGAVHSSGDAGQRLQYTFPPTPLSPVSAFKCMNRGGLSSAGPSSMLQSVQLPQQQPAQLHQASSSAGNDTVLMAPHTLDLFKSIWDGSGGTTAVAPAAVVPQQQQEHQQSTRVSQQAAHSATPADSTETILDDLLLYMSLHNAEEPSENAAPTLNTQQQQQQQQYGVSCTGQGNNNAAAAAGLQSRGADASTTTPQRPANASQMRFW